jgi:calcineurin-like phosphoesterase family protein
MKERRTNADVWFTSDQHFYHRNIIKYCERPFADLDEMHQTIVDNYQAVVKPEDYVYFLGDFAMGPRKLTRPETNKLFQEVMDQLPGRKILIRGNHDYGANGRYYDIGFEKVSHQMTFQRQKIILTHDPGKISFSNAPQGWRWIVGHVHQAWRYKGWKQKKTKMINVGVDVQGFAPIHWTDLIEQFDQGNGI